MKKTPWLLFALIAVTAVAYYPAWHGGMLWDDDKHLTKAALRSVDGLRRIWFEPGATQQYYPVVHSAFWVMHRLWGHATIGYHLANITLHAISAFLIALILRRLAVPGAALAAFLFALHPLHVESVAWMTELKNTLSGAFCLGAALAYLTFDAERLGRSYVVALLLFVLALMSKTVTAMLPAALLVIFWWQRGRLAWRRDVQPLVPFVILAVAAGLVTVWVERTFIGARGGEFELSAIDRVLVAGRAVWFYLAKILWPADLIFVYPRWQIDRTVWWQYLYPIAAVGVLAGCWSLRRRSRTPLAVALLFCALLFPALGFVNVYPFRFSFVADHFAYLASIPIIAVVANRIAELKFRATGTVVARNFSSASASASAIALAAILGFLTFAQSRHYRDAETLYRATLDRNPSAWMASINLGVLELERNPREAATHFESALRVAPNVAEAHNDLGMALHRLGDVSRAMTEYREAVRLDPGLAEAHANVCAALNQLGRPGEAALECAEALKIHYDYPEAHYNLARAAQALGRPEAETHLREVLRLRPDLADAHNDLGALLLSMGRDDEAIRHFSEAVRLRPDYADAHFNLANLLQRAGRLEDAVASYRRAIAYRPSDAAAYNNLGVALERLGRVIEATAAYRESLRLNPRSAEARENVARMESGGR